MEFFRFTLRGLLFATFLVALYFPSHLLVAILPWSLWNAYLIPPCFALLSGLYAGCVTRHHPSNLQRARLGMWAGTFASTVVAVSLVVELGFALYSMGYFDWHEQWSHYVGAPIFEAVLGALIGGLAALAIPRRPRTIAR